MVYTQEYYGNAVVHVLQQNWRVRANSEWKKGSDPILLINVEAQVFISRMVGRQQGRDTNLGLHQ